MAYYRADGVRITHDPYARGMAEKYGAPGKTDADGFDPYADSVGPGIYGGTVKRDDMGQVVIGRQYQNHNPRPGPVYSGGGYTPTSKRLSDAAALEAWLNEHPDLVNEITTGGAQPLHNCGMSARNQDQVALLVSKGADIEAVDTYGYTPLHRMASNNLAAGAKALLEAGADPNFRGGSGETAAAAKEDVEVRLKALQKLEASIDATTAWDAEMVGKVDKALSAFGGGCLDPRVGAAVARIRASASAARRAAAIEAAAAPAAAPARDESAAPAGTLC